MNIDVNGFGFRAFFAIAVLSLFALILYAWKRSKWYEWLIVICLIAGLSWLIVGSTIHPNPSLMHPSVVVGTLPDSQSSPEAAITSLLHVDRGIPLSAPPRLPEKELVQIYTEKLVAGARERGLSDRSLAGSLDAIDLRGELPYAAYSMKLHGSTCWLILTMKLGDDHSSLWSRWWHNRSAPKTLTRGSIHGSAYAVDSSKFTVLARDSCYCF